MQTGCSDILEAKVAERNEKAKKLYRYVSDVARRVDEASAASRSIVDLFSTKIEVLRQKLRDNCEKLLFLDPSNYGKKSLELLWRKGYYETVSAARKYQESDTAIDNFLFTHIGCGIGHFHHILNRMQAIMKILPGELDYELMFEDGESESEAQLSEEEVKLGRYVIYQCLIYLGDLSRYQVEIFQNYEPSTAARYYLQAAHIDMCSGMPFNQLGNLYLDKNYNLESVCYYIHCLSCTTPFEGATGNLLKILEKQTQYCETLNDAETYTQAEHIQNTVANFLSLIDIWYFSKNDTNVPQRCNKIAQDLRIAMEFAKSPFPDMNKNYTEYTQAVEEESTTPSYLNGNLVHKMVQICLFTVSKMMEIDEQKAFACKAFTLALLSQLLQKLLKQMEELGFKNPARKYRVRSVSINDVESEKSDNQANNANESEVIEDTIINKEKIPPQTETEDAKEISDGDNKKLENGDSKPNLKKTKRRRRRRVDSSESSDLTGSDSESIMTSDDACSDDDNEDDLSDSTYKSDDDSRSEESIFDDSDEEETVENLNGDVNKSPKPIEDANTPISKVNGIDHIQKNTTKKQDIELKEEEIQDFLMGDNYLPSIKLLLDWVLLEKELILSCGDSGESLFQCVVDLLNIFTFYFYPKNNDVPGKLKILSYAKHIAMKLKLEYKKIPLPEDLNLRGTNICKFDKDAAEWQILNKYQPSVYEENVIRILNFIDFGNQIAKIVPRIRFNRSMKIFYFKKISAPKLNTKINHKKSREWHNSKTPHHEGSGGLLRRLGRLWLTAQVRELERRPAAPALLALDAAALLLHLRSVKQLLKARSFVLLVPTVVLQELDDLKRSQHSARDAIRWLEAALRSGSRFLRAQRPGQSRPLPLLKYPKKAPPHVTNFIQILEFCHHLTADEKQSGQGEPDRGKTNNLLILLVGNQPGTDEYKEFSVTGAAQAAGVTVQHIGDFYAKWRQTVNKTGKKR